MEIVILQSAEEIASVVADAVEQVLRAHAAPVLGLATGSSPLPVYRELVRRHTEDGLSLAHSASSTIAPALSGRQRRSLNGTHAGSTPNRATSRRLSSRGAFLLRPGRIGAGRRPPAASSLTSRLCTRGRVLRD